MGKPRIPRQFIYERLEWMHRAACRGMGTAMFFGAVDDYYANAARPVRAQARDIRALCRNCPVMAECRSHALTFPEPYGIWGGLTRKDRNRLRRQHVPGTV